MHNQAGGLVLPPLPASLPSPSDQSFPQSYRSTPGSLREHSTELIRRPGSRFPSGATPMIQAANISPSASSLPSIGQVVGGGHASNMPLTVFPDHPGRSQASAPSHALGSTFDGVVDPVSGRISAFHARSSPDLTPPTCTPIPREALNQAPDAPFFVPTQELPGDLEFLLNTPNYWVYDPGPVAFSQTVLGCEWVTQVRMYVPMVLIDGVPFAEQKAGKGSSPGGTGSRKRKRTTDEARVEKQSRTDEQVAGGSDKRKCPTDEDTSEPQFKANNIAGESDGPGTRPRKAADLRPSPSPPKQCSALL
ncbi:hypothetical protein CONLIGDRAFT_717274 [Coniochaeta ligniaria NRRL 30616]|uniref:Uncharacterized protein n=1 Tax=Coniochaeta ligniaria NRRL 30616 TaxID=1408157 RepID=A0A1J7IE06_9PEZI|nr:hypothetical protein CONLIGDRAFT_717274 [Coniochaeta ligniaria NRRL 30616]